MFFQTLPGLIGKSQQLQQMDDDGTWNRVLLGLVIFGFLLQPQFHNRPLWVSRCSPMFCQGPKQCHHAVDLLQNLGEVRLRFQWPIPWWKCLVVTGSDPIKMSGLFGRHSPSWLLLQFLVDKLPTLFCLPTATFRVYSSPKNYRNWMKLVKILLKYIVV